MASANGYNSGCDDDDEVKGVYWAWTAAWAEVSASPAITRERQEMEAIVYFHPYGNATNTPY